VTTTSLVLSAVIAACLCACGDTADDGDGGGDADMDADTDADTDTDTRSDTGSETDTGTCYCTDLLDCGYGSSRCCNGCTCSYTTSDPENCGGCGVVCDEGLECVIGVCK